jgi:hypothetical protein
MKNKTSEELVVIESEAKGSSLWKSVDSDEEQISCLSSIFLLIRAALFLLVLHNGIL